MKKETFYIGADRGGNSVGGDPGSGRWLGRKWLVHKGNLHENEENAHNLNLQGKNAGQDDSFCLGIARQGAEQLAALVRMAAAADRQALQGGFLYAAYQGGTMLVRGNLFLS